MRERKDHSGPEHATSKYFEQEDDFSRWQKDCLAWEGTVTAAEAFHCWLTWCKATPGAKPRTARKFMTVCINRGMRRGPNTAEGHATFTGVSIAKRDFTINLRGTHTQMVELCAWCDRRGLEWSRKS